MTLEIFEIIAPTEENGYCVFAPELEEDDKVFFHMTPAENKDAIIEKGFLSAQDLGVGSLCSVSYAKRSSSCFANIGNSLASGHVIFAVRETLHKSRCSCRAAIGGVESGFPAAV